MLSTEETPKHNNLKEKFVLLPARKYAYRTKPCKYFENGCCLYGRKCRFIRTTNSKPCKSKQRVDVLKLEMEKKLEEFQTIITAHAPEITDLKRCLQDLLASQPPLMSTESQKSPLDTQNKPRKNISESKNSCSSTLQHVTRHCELCEKTSKFAVFQMSTCLLLWSRSSS